MNKLFIPIASDFMEQTEQQKLNFLKKYYPLDTLHELKQSILQRTFEDEL